MKFLDLVKVYIKSGNGGSGALSFRREKYIEKGGPDGGNGGRGGSVWGIPDVSLNTLIDFKYKQHHFAKNGKPGQGKKKTGESGDDIYLKLPLGTEILDEEQKVILGEINTTTDKVLIIPGGNGGLGNHNFKSSTNRAPRNIQKGEEGEELWVWLRLKLIADVGIVGLPNAGKSSLLSKITAAKPKVADYPFTTLTPQIGVVYDNERDFVIADIPGLIEGAHVGVGLGTKFLGHIERCSILLHLIDGNCKNIVSSYFAIRNEINLYGFDLDKKIEIVVISKSDSITDEQVEMQINNLVSRTNKKPLVISSLTGQGCKKLINKINNILFEVKQNKQDEQEIKNESFI